MKQPRRRRSPSMRMVVAIATLFGNCVAAAPGDQPWDASLKVVVNHGRSRTIGSATVVPPVQDASGNWHWLAIGCWHQFRGYRGEPITLSCSTSDVVYHNARLLTSDRQSDLSVIAFVPSRACANVPLAPLNTVIRGSSAYTIGYPSGSHRGKPVILTLQTVRGRIQQGHSGGGLFVRGKLAGVASATDAYNGPSSYFADAQQVRRIYATACGILGCKPRPDGGGYDKPPINPNPNPAPSPAPPPIPGDSDLVKRVEELERKLKEFELLQGEKGDKGDTGPRGPPPTEDQIKAAVAVAFQQNMQVFLLAAQNAARDEISSNPDKYRGLPGQDATANVDSLIAQVIKSLDPVILAFHGADGEEPIIRQAKLGEPLPVGPVKMRLKDLDAGTTYTQTRALGGDPIKIAIEGLAVVGK